jgi:hypothetical protein
LGQAVTDEVIEYGPGRSTHRLQHLRAKTSLETYNLLSIRVDKLWSIARKIIESVQILHRRPGALSEPQNSATFIAISSGGI